MPDNKTKKEMIALLENYQKALSDWQNGLDDYSDDSSVRTYINRNTRAVERIVRRARCFRTITVSPPPIVGGMIARDVNPFGCIFQPPYGLSMVPLISDIIDETIGVILAGDLQHLSDEPKKSDKKPKAVSNSKIFLVHGRDNEAKQTVARFLEKLDLETIILHEKPSGGLTIIEKFEKHSDVGYAVVLLTPDDLGGLKEERDKSNFRARQNVIFELGYFMGRLGRNKVCALLKGDIERPSDSDGIIYVGMDPFDGWKTLLGREMKEAGLDIDLNKTI